MKFRKFKNSKIHFFSRAYLHIRSQRWLHQDVGRVDAPTHYYCGLCYSATTRPSDLQRWCNGKVHPSLQTNWKQWWATCLVWRASGASRCCSYLAYPCPRDLEKNKLRIIFFCPVFVFFLPGGFFLLCFAPALLFFSCGGCGDYCSGRCCVPGSFLVNARHSVL